MARKNRASARNNARAVPPERAVWPPLDRTFLLGLLAVAVLAFIVRVVVVAEVSGTAYHRHLVLDAATYSRIAIEGDPREPFWQPPLYPWFLRAVYTVAGPSPGAVRVVQALFGALLAAGTALLTRRFAGPRWALGAGVAVALLGPLINADIELLPSGPAALLVVAWVLGLLTPGAAGGWWRPVRPAALGLALGLMGLLIPTLAFAGLAALLWLARGEGWRPALVFALLAVVPVAAVTARNARYERDLVPVSYNGGINFWIGNNADYPATVGIRPGIHWTHLVEKPRCEGGAVSRAQESGWFFSQGLRFAAEHPVRFTRNILWKAAATISAHEIGRNRDDYAVRDESAVMSVLLWPFGFPGIVLLPLAALGASALIRNRAATDARALWLVLLVAGGILLASIVFFPTGRYRVPALPLLVVLAAAGLPRFRPVDLAPAAAVLGIGFVPAGIPAIPASETFYEIAIDIDQDGGTADAVPIYRRSLELQPDNADAVLSLGLALGKLGQQEAGRELLERTTQLMPDADVAWQGLAVYWMQRRDTDRAREALERAVTLDPCNRRALAMLAHVLMDQGNLNTARARLEQARQTYRRFDPELDRAWRRLDQLTGAGGRPR